MKKENKEILRNKDYYQALKTKYTSAAKDAASSGDYFLSEYNLQFVEHYNRIINERFGKKIVKKIIVKKKTSLDKSTKSDDIKEDSKENLTISE